MGRPPLQNDRSWPTPDPIHGLLKPALSRHALSPGVLPTTPPCLQLGPNPSQRKLPGTCSPRSSWQNSPILTHGIPGPWSCLRYSKRKGKSPSKGNRLWGGHNAGGFQSCCFTDSATSGDKQELSAFVSPWNDLAMQPGLRGRPYSITEHWGRTGTARGRMERPKVHLCWGNSFHSRSGQSHYLSWATPASSRPPDQTLSQLPTPA